MTQTPPPQDQTTPPPTPDPAPPAPGAVPPDVSNKKLVCGILGILLGGWGIHKFVLGYSKAGVIQILLSFLCGIGAIIGLIEGIMYLTKSDEEFYQTYMVGTKEWF